MMRNVRPIAAMTPLMLAAPALAQPFEITWYTVDCGGVTTPIETFPYTLKGSIGQFDPSYEIVTGGFGVTGGFWNRNIACRPDYNGDGTLDAFDYDDFVSAYFAFVNSGTGFPDYNADGTVDAFDYDDFVSDFFNGC